jgi:TP901 family phage tail tape measure protein
VADRSVKVRLDADVSGYQAQMRTAVKATQDFTKRSHDSIQKHRASINDLSNAALGIGAGLIAGAGLAAKAAMDWESAWTGVQKTVEGTDQEMASLEQGLRDMAKSLPATHAEIAAVAEAAGQLGVATPNIESFTRTMIDMGEATNLSAEEAATQLARFMNVMGTSQADVGKLGAAVVGLGNSFATTESEIVAMGQRLSGAGAQAGLTEGEVLGLAAAMSSVGIEAEAGGSAMSQTMKRIGKAVDEGGDSLELFAQVSGMTADEFAQAWQNDPAVALDTFITGLSSVEEQGMTTNGVLAELGITGIRESDSLLRLSAAAGSAAEAMAQGNDEFADGSALMEEASKRYETAESKLAMLRNTFVDLGIDMGGAVAPMLGDVADNISFLVSKFQELPDVAKQGLGLGAGIAGMALLAVGGLGKALTAASDLKLAMESLGIATQGAGAKMKALGVATGVGVAITALTTIVGGYINQAAKAESSSKKLVDAFDEVTGKANENAPFLLLQELNSELDKANWEKLSELGYEYQDFTSAIMAGGDEMAAFREELHARWLEAPLFSEERDALSEAIGALDTVGKGYQLTAEQAKVLADQQEKTGASAETMAAQEAIATAAVEETGVALDGTIEKLSEFLDLLFATGLATMSARDAQAAFHESVEGVDEAVEQINAELGGMSAALNENKTDFDLTTEAGRVANGAFQEVAQSGMDLTKAMADNGATQDELQGSLQTTYDDLLTAAQGMGLSEQAAEDLTREILGIPDDVDIETWMSDEAEKQAEATQRAISNVDRSITVTTYFRSFGAPGVNTGGGSSRPGGTSMTANADGNVWESPTRIKRFANGSENHVAQIAGAGSMRLWAEPETGGEAYIPLAASKRARSERILADVANRFGMGLSKFENGGMVLPYEPRRAQTASAAAVRTSAPEFNIYGPDPRAVAGEAYSLYRHHERTETARL